jgi:hypothetical protein
MALHPEEHQPYGVTNVLFPDVKDKISEKTSNLLYLVSIPVGLLIVYGSWKLYKKYKKVKSSK